MVALLDSFEDASLGSFETHVSIVPTDGAAPAEVDIRVEKVSAACDAIAHSRYDFDDRALDLTVDAVHRTLAMTA